MGGPLRERFPAAGPSAAPQEGQEQKCSGRIRAPSGKITEMDLSLSLTGGGQRCWEGTGEEENGCLDIMQSLILHFLVLAASMDWIGISLMSPWAHSELLHKHYNIISHKNTHMVSLNIG